MMVTFISQCEKNALKKTRRVLDAFANRIGDNTWQTVITEDGLSTVKKMLRKTASKSTAVSCHWIRTRSRSQYLWAVGNKSKFSSEGVVPVNSTKRNLLNSEIENDWKYLPLVKALTALSALFHDWGKASKLFQNKLKPNSQYKYKGDPIRHEWISTLLFYTLVNSANGKTDEAWLNDLADGNLNEKKLKVALAKEGNVPLSTLPNAAKLISWLILSHHRLPLVQGSKKEIKNVWQGEELPNIDAVLKVVTQAWGYENRQNAGEYEKRVAACFTFPEGLLSDSNTWLKNVKKWTRKLKEQLPLLNQAMQDGSYRLILHHSRLCLMLGDHYYSSKEASNNKNYCSSLYANTDRETNGLKQKLDEHLDCVAKAALQTAHLLPAFEQEPPLAENVQSLRIKSTGIYRWQETAVENINTWKNTSDKKSRGFFAVNMASTGCGKTYANAKVMRALSTDGKSLRYILALGLRTLTLQTGDEYREKIGLDNSALAVLIGSKAVAELHNNQRANDETESYEKLGSESAQPLLDEYVDFDCEIPEEGMVTLLKEAKHRKFLYAPVLSCTIDHLMAATETKRGGRYILPALRLMSSDLVIDEIDDFTGSDLIAIGRLIHLAGMLGRKVMISSATIPPDLAEGYFNAYKKGWQLYCLSRDEAVTEVGCAWVDEFNTNVTTINTAESNSAIKSYSSEHNKFLIKRVKALKEQPSKRKATIIECHQSMEELEFDEEETKQERYFSIVHKTILEKHQQHHTVDEKTGIAVSFGVVRVANIKPCVALTKYLLDGDPVIGCDIKAMAYHSQQVMLLRHIQEKHLDSVLKRKEKSGAQPKAFENEVIRLHLDNCTEKNIIFVLVATPVEEVGRDHDFDWAVVEPSSYRSIVQLAGRVRRHRDGEVEHTNMALMQYNWKAFRAGDKEGEKYFNRPGYEETVRMETHDLKQLLDGNALDQGVDAIPRIQKIKNLNCKKSLIDIEHGVIQSQLTRYPNLGPESMQGYLTGGWHLTAMPQKLNPFRDGEISTNLFLYFDDEKETYFFAEKDDRGWPINREGPLDIAHTQLSEKAMASLWLYRNYEGLLEGHIRNPDLPSKRKVSLRYGELNIVLRERKKYEYNDQLGLVETGTEGV